MALKHFFKLNGTPVEFETEKQLLDHFRTSTELRNVIYLPSELAPINAEGRFQSRKFVNVSFKRTLIKGIDFKDCHFEDCLLLGTRFVECEFHDCTLVGCNPYDARFERTYIDPRVFEGTLDPTHHSNIGVKLFHSLLENAHATYQREFANTAEFNFRLWKRYQLNYDRRRRRINWVQYVRRWLPNALYHYVAGYGLRAKFVAVWALAAVGLIWMLNFLLWDRMGMIGRNGPIADSSALEVLYFSVVTLSTLGYGDITPSSRFGMGIVAAEVVFGVVLLGVVASILVRRMVR